MTTPLYMPLCKAARMIGVHPDTIRRKVKSGHVEEKRFGPDNIDALQRDRRLRLVRWSDVEALLH
jgi:hypothetical protein